MNPSSREIYVIGVFDCGCNYESSFSSVEIVRCSNTAEINNIKKKMNKHASEYQCEFRHALCLMVFEGKFISLKFGYGVKSYKGYIRTWNRRNKEGNKMARELRKIDTLFTRKGKWMNRYDIYKNKIAIQEDANTGCGST